MGEKTEIQEEATLIFVPAKAILLYPTIDPDGRGGYDECTEDAMRYMVADFEDRKCSQPDAVVVLTNTFDGGRLPLGYCTGLSVSLAKHPTEGELLALHGTFLIRSEVAEALQASFLSGEIRPAIGGTYLSFEVEQRLIGKVRTVTKARLRQVALIDRADAMQPTRIWLTPEEPEIAVQIEAAALTPPEDSPAGS